MRRYETIIIIDPDLSEDQRKPLIQRLEDLIPQQDGLLVTTDEWGAKRLAYKIKKKARGFYIRIDFCGTSALVNEMERFLKIDDRALKYMTVLTETHIDIEEIQKEIAEKTAKAETKEESHISNATTEDENDAEQGSPEEVTETETPESETPETDTIEKES
jgi:small subunit ribosomal protein S6